MTDKKIEKYFHDILDRYGRENYVFIRYTDHPERNAGINPKYDFDTPLGVYAYQLNQITINKILLNDSDFSYGRSYGGMNIFYFPKNAGGRKIILNEKGEDPKYTEKIFANDKRILKSHLLGEIDPQIYHNLLHSLEYNFENYENAAKYKTNFNKIFNITRQSGFFRSKNRKNSYIWTELLRKVLNISLIIDNGSGTIHSNEPYQSVIFDTSKIQIIYSGDNLFQEEKRKKFEHFIPYIANLMQNQNTLFKFSEINYFGEIVLLTNDLDLISEKIIIEQSDTFDAAQSNQIRLWLHVKDPKVFIYKNNRNDPRKLIISYYHDLMKIIFDFLHIIKIIQNYIQNKSRNLDSDTKIKKNFPKIDYGIISEPYVHFKLISSFLERIYNVFCVHLPKSLVNEDFDYKELADLLNQIYDKITPIANQLDGYNYNSNEPPKRLKIKLHTSSK